MAMDTLTCFTVRMLGVRYTINAPMPPGTARDTPPELAPGAQTTGSPGEPR